MDVPSPWTHIFVAVSNVRYKSKTWKYVWLSLCTCLAQLISECYKECYREWGTLMIENYSQILGISSREVSPLSDKSASESFSSNVLDRSGILLLLELPPLHSELLGKQERDNVIIVIPSSSLSLFLSLSLPPAQCSVPFPFFGWRLCIAETGILYGCGVYFQWQKHSSQTDGWMYIHNVREGTRKMTDSPFFWPSRRLGFDVVTRKPRQTFLLHFLEGNFFLFLEMMFGDSRILQRGRDWGRGWREPSSFTSLWRGRDGMSIKQQEMKNFLDPNVFSCSPVDPLVQEPNLSWLQPVSTKEPGKKVWYPEIEWDGFFFFSFFTLKLWFIPLLACLLFLLEKMRREKERDGWMEDGDWKDEKRGEGASFPFTHFPSSDWTFLSLSSNFNSFLIRKKKKYWSNWWERCKLVLSETLKNECGNPTGLETLALETRNDVDENEESK